MRRMSLKLAVATAFASILAFGAAGTASAENEKTVEQTQAEAFFAQLPPAPANCYLQWDPIEDAIEAFIEGPPEVPVPQWADDWFDAFDDWCEGDND